MSHELDLSAVHATLVRAGVVFEPGLSDAEFAEMVDESPDLHAVGCRGR